MTAYTADTWLTPIVLTPGTDNVFVITEDPGGGNEQVLVVTLHQDTTSTAAETWYLHDDESFHATKPGLLYAIRKLLTDGTTTGCGTKTGTTQNAYTWAVIDPTSSTGLTDNGIQLRADAANYTWEISWTHASFTLDGLLLGATVTAPIADQASTTSGSDEVVSMPHATKHRMVTRDLLGDGGAVDKRRNPFKMGWGSSERPSDSVKVIFDEGYVRPFVYSEVPGVEVHQDRASESEWAGIMGRATGDNKATWYDVWDALTDGLEVVVVHNTTSGFQVDANSYEVGKLDADAGWGGMFAQTSPGGDLYDVTIPLWVDTANSSYSH